MRIGKGLVVFVTGGASGLGEATVRRLHKAGCSVACADVQQDRMDALTKELGSQDLLMIKCNVTKEQEVEDAIKKTVEMFGAVHVALTCAGVVWPSQTLTTQSSLDTKKLELMYRINVFGSVYVAKHAAIAMSKNKASEHGDKGVILFVSSIAAEEAARGQVAYGGTKGAINGMVMPMARDLGKFGIRVAAIAPGIFKTPLGAQLPKENLAVLEKMSVFQRAGDPDEFAHFVGSIIENAYISGVRLRIDGATKLANL